VLVAGDLLLIASAERDGVPLRIESIGAGDLLESVRNRFAWRAQESDRRLQVDAPTDITLSGDRLGLEQALGNLVATRETAREPRSGSACRPQTGRSQRSGSRQRSSGRIVSMTIRSPSLLALSLLVAASVAGAGCRSGGAKPAATGDIPDSQVFLTYADASGGYAIRYPEGWTRSGAGAAVTFRDKDNAIRVAVARGQAPTAASTAAALARLKTAEPSMRATSPPQVVALAHGRALKLRYSVLGAANPVTGKRPLLLVDRYVYAHGGKVATVDLATPKGVDNVDAYRMISRSFAWR
jgi:hypothetical protein